MGYRITYSDVCISLASRMILEDINVEIDAGTFAVLIGANGAGKTTLLKSTAQLLLPKSGAITMGIRGQQTDIYHGSVRTRRSLRKQVGYISQTLDLVPSLSVLRNVQFGWVSRMGLVHAIRYSSSRRGQKDTAEVLESLGLGHVAHRSVGSLSRGEKQRVSLARLLLQTPEVIIADEPTSSMDPRNALLILDLLSQMSQRGTTILCALHHVEQAVLYGDEIFALDARQVIRLGNASSLTAEELIVNFQDRDPSEQ